MNWPNCQYCGIQEASCEAHIIPRKFYQRLMVKERRLLLVGSGRGGNQKQTQSGIWEKGILCSDCDRKIGELDKYAYSVLPVKVNPSDFGYFDGKNDRICLGSIDVERFKRFIVSMAWRASLAKHLLFRHIKLGPYESRCLDYLKGQATPEVAESLQVVLCYQNQPKWNTFMLSPYRTDYGGVTVNQFYLPPWMVILKCDKREFDSRMSGLVLRNGQPVVAFVRSSWAPGELQIFSSVRDAVDTDSDVKA